MATTSLILTLTLFAPSPSSSLSSPVLEKVVEYLEWAHKFSGASEGTRVPDFEKQIPPELALELLMTADFLDV